MESCASTTTTTTYHSPLPLATTPLHHHHHHHHGGVAAAAAAPEDSSSVQVAVRVRPMLPSEAGSATCVDVLHQTSSTSSRPSVVRIGGTSGPTFTFDEAFATTSTQQQVFEHRVIPLLRNCLEGYNATIVAYGQTGSGKTFTIMGPSSACALQEEEASMGIIPRALRYLFDEMDVLVRQQQPLEQEHGPQDDDDEVMDEKFSPTPKLEYDVRVQFLELYGEEIRDLLTPTPSSERLMIRDVGMEEPEVLGASQQKVNTAEEALLCLTRGMLRRVTGATAMNSSSSRSHAILSVLVEQSILIDADSSNGNNNVQVKRSKFNFVDLAGSERQKRTQAEGQRLKEGIDINKGLLVLGNVISALGDPTKSGKSFVPYRDSKLTRLLKGSLGGNHKTLMIACISPSSDNMEESLNCLRYANRAKNIQNHAIVNVDTNTRLLSELKGQVQALASDLLRARHGDMSSSAFTNGMLQAMLANGGGHVIAGSPTNFVTPPFKPFPASATPNARDANFARINNGNVSGDELDRIRHLLQQTVDDLKEKEEQLSVSRAENEMQRLQLMALTGSTSSSSSTSTADVERELFLQKAKEYEKEIAALKNKVRSVERDASADAIWDKAVDLDAVEKASKEIEMERAQLSDLQSTISSSPGPRLQQEEEIVENLSHSDHLEAEETAEHAQVSALTNKYLGDFIELEEEVDTFVVAAESEQVEEHINELDTSGRRRQKQLEAHMIELSHRIDAKEELIQQLQVSQERYAVSFAAWLASYSG